MWAGCGQALKIDSVLSNFLSEPTFTTTDDQFSAGARQKVTSVRYQDDLYV